MVVGTGVSGKWGHGTSSETSEETEYLITVDLEKMLCDGKEQIGRNTMGAYIKGKSSIGHHHKE